MTNDLRTNIILALAEPFTDEDSLTDRIMEAVNHVSGVWVTTWAYEFEIVEKIFLTELEAHRALDASSGGKVRFFPFGTTLDEVVDAEKKNF